MTTRITTLNLPEFTRTMLGFDHLLNDNKAFQNPGYPPYNVEKSGDDKYQITVALAGFSKDELNIQLEEGTLVVSGSKQEIDDSEIEYLHKGIANRDFERSWKLAEYVEVVDAKMDNGMLYISLERMVPEEKQPKTIDIQ